MLALCLSKPGLCDKLNGMPNVFAEASRSVTRILVVVIALTGLPDLFAGKIEDFSFSDYSIDYRGNDEPLVDGIVAYSDVNKLIRFYSDLLAHMNTDPN